jgi:hypothetical protein
MDGRKDQAALSKENNKTLANSTRDKNMKATSHTDPTRVPFLFPSTYVHVIQKTTLVSNIPAHPPLDQRE